MRLRPYVARWPLVMNPGGNRTGSWQACWPRALRALGDQPTRTSHSRALRIVAFAPSDFPWHGGMVMKKSAPILVVEDDAASRELVRQLLGSEGYEVVEARDGREGVGILVSD